MQLTPRSLWRHRKHDPGAGKFHQYEIICVTAAAQERDRHGDAYALACLFTSMHTETAELWEVCGNSGPNKYLWNSATGEWCQVPMVIYVGIHDPLGMPWARELSQFIDGRFTQLTPMETTKC